MNPKILLLPTVLSLCAVTGLHAAETSRGLLLVANKGDHTLSIVDPVAGDTLAVVPEDGVTGHEVVASPDGTSFREICFPFASTVA